MTARTDKLKPIKDGEYSLIKVHGKIAPVVYANMLKGMDVIGLHNESSYIAMAIKKLNDELVKS